MADLGRSVKLSRVPGWKIHGLSRQAGTDPLRTFAVIQMPGASTNPRHDRRRDGSAHCDAGGLADGYVICKAVDRGEDYDECADAGKAQLQERGLDGEA